MFDRLFHLVKKILGSPILSIILLLLTVFFIFFNIYKGDLQFWDEATNTGVVIESSKHNDWWNLKYNGENFWEKPPLFYWVGIVFYKIFQNNFNIYSFRLITGLTTLSLILISFFFVKKSGTEKANITLMLFLAIPFLWLFSPTGVLATHNFRSFDSDILQTLFIATSCLVTNSYFEKKKVHKIIISGALMGLGVMTKGAFGFIPIIFLIVKLFENYKKENLKLREIVKTLAIFLGISSLIILPWHIYMYLNFENEFIEKYFIYHQINRTSQPLEGHSKPFYFYILYLLDPRSGFVLIPLLIVFLAKIKKNTWLVLGTIILLAFSLIQTKISWYILPSVPFFIFYISQTFELKKNLITLLTGSIFLFQIFSNLQKIVLLPNSFNLSNFEYLSTLEPHRVFYAFELAGKAKELKLENELPEKFIIDKNEFSKLEETLRENKYEVSYLESVSDNFAIAHTMKIN